MRTLICQRHLANDAAGGQVDSETKSAPSGADVFTLDPDTLELRSTARIVDDGVPLEMLNELEVVDGELWANLYGSDCLARISLDGSWSVLGWVVLSDIMDRRQAFEAAVRARRDPPDRLERHRLELRGAAPLRHGQVVAAALRDRSGATE
ncbi:unnamed protein product [Prorocentrum cordatum]|uniref:Uncharacterized protein n=1 Tax=Prorocentrum cordatum TaxID=2364126 RepID=A0ABN9T080_9DINO|nr:unnamed protein product [Polarella glacialis]